MTGEDYLAQVLQVQSIEEGAPEWADMDSTFDDVCRALAGGLPDASPAPEKAGSTAKGTLIRASFDLDVVVYFDNDDEGAGDTLKAIYENVQAALEESYKVEPKRSAIKIVSGKGGEAMPFTVDVVPGRFMNEDAEDVFLYQAEGDKNRLQTNLRKHVTHMQDSGHVDIIKLAKVWKLRCDLDVKTFVLELLVVEALTDCTALGLLERMQRLWTVLRDDVDDLELEDPANPTGNDLSAIFGDAEKQALSGAAAVALDLVETEDWEGIFGVDLDAAEDEPEATPLVVLEDRSHRALPPWTTTTALAHSVGITATVYPPRGRAYELKSGGNYITDGCQIRYLASTTLPRPFEVRWQVVNTGAHAREVGGLRGQDFFTSRARGSTSTPSPEPLITWESSSYTGTHTIQCFLVRDGVLLAASLPFELRVLNRSRRGHRPPRPRRRRRW